MRTIILAIILIVSFSISASAEQKDFIELGVKGYSLVYDTKFDEANKIFDEMIKMKPDNALGYLLKSRSYLLRLAFGTNDDEYIEKFEKTSFQAAKIAEEMLDKNKNDVDALFYLGGIYGYLGYYYGSQKSYFKAIRYGRKGVNYLEKAIEKDPEYYDAYLGFGLYHYLIGSAPKSVRGIASMLLGIKGDMKKGLEEMLLASSKGKYLSDEAKYVLANQIYMGNEQNFEAASNILKELISKYPNNGSFQMNLAMCYKNIKKYDEAITVLEEIYQKNPDDMNISLQLGWTYLDSSQADKAFNTFEKIIEDNPEYAHGYYQIGRTSVISGQRLEEADKYFLKYLDMKQFKNNPSEAWAHFRLGQVYEMTGKIEQAKTQYKTALKLDSKHKEAKEALKKIK